jgi:hypothetical protein
MADNTRNYWVFLLRLSSSFPKNTTFRRLIFFRPQAKGCEAPARFDPLEKSNLLLRLSLRTEYLFRFCVFNNDFIMWIITFSYKYFTCLLFYGLAVHL